MTRLAIIDPEFGSQPMQSSDGNIILIFNGELYNHIELREELLALGHNFSTDSDTEVFLSAYSEWGASSVHYMNGMFAVAIYDRARGKLLLIRDRIGEKPLYFYCATDSGNLFFASEHHPLARCTPLSSFNEEHLNLHSLAWYFAQKAMPSGSTIDQRISELPPGCILEYTLADKSLSIRSYYEIRELLSSKVDDVHKHSEDAAAIPPENPLSLTRETETLSGRGRVLADTELVDKLEQLLLESVRIRMRADVEVGTFLSGGVDSSLLTSMAARLTKKPLRTFSLVYDDDIYNKGADRHYARAVSRSLGTNHVEVTLTPELFADELPRIVRQFSQPNCAAFANWFVSQEMGKEVKVGLSGDGADELFGSYFLHRVAGAMEVHGDTGAIPENLTDYESRFALQHLGLPLSDMVDAFSVFPPEARDKLFLHDRLRGFVGNRMKRVEEDLTSTSLLNRALEFDCKSMLVDQILNYADVLSMAHSLELRMPFLDHLLVDFSFSLPSHLKIRNGCTKYILKRVAERYLPNDLVYRPKEGFIEPNIYWLSSHLEDFCRSVVQGASFDRFSILNRAYVSELIETYYSSNDFYLGKQVWSLFLFGLWEKSLDE